MIDLWGRPNSICTQRVLWACTEVGVDFELHLASATMGPKGHVSTGAQPYGAVGTPWYRAMNPNDTVPTLKDGDVVLWESNAIVGYLATHHGTGALYGNNMATLALANQWMSWTNERLEPCLHTLVMHLHRLIAPRRSHDALDAAARDIEPWVDVVEKNLSVQPFMVGDAFTIGDIPTGAALYRWKQFDIDRPATPNVDAWLARLGSREGFARHIAPRAFHLS